MSTQESGKHASAGFSTPAYLCWGGWIRTTDYLIQSFRGTEIGQKSVLDRFGCGICIERDGKSKTFPSAWHVEEHIKDDHFGRKYEIRKENGAAGQATP